MIKGGNSINRYGVGSLPRYKYTYMYQYAQPRLDSSEHAEFRRRKNLEMVFFHQHNVHASNIYFRVRSRKLMKPHSQ